LWHAVLGVWKFSCLPLRFLKLKDYTVSDNITKRTCANCAAFNPAPASNEPSCWNLVSITTQAESAQALTRAPGPSDSCNSHQTYEEALEQGVFIDAHRDATWTQTHLKRE
jgi:hypothetical protein